MSSPLVLLAIVIGLTLAGFAVAVLALWLFEHFSGLRVPRSGSTPNSYSHPYNEIKHELETIVQPLASGPRDDIRNVLAALYTGSWQAAVQKMGEILPAIIQQQANSSRPSHDIARDVVLAIIRSLEFDLLSPLQIREAQSKKEVTEVWVAAYPFLDLADAADGGLYETTRDNLNLGKRFVFFQPDRYYFDLLLDRLRGDGVLKNSVVLDEGQEGCQLCVVPAEGMLLGLGVSIWNPEHQSRKVFLNTTGDAISLREEDGRWKVTSAVVMKPCDGSSAHDLYEDLRKVYESFRSEASVRGEETEAEAPPRADGVTAIADFKSKRVKE